VLILENKTEKENPIYLNLKEIGVRLRFNAKLQTLELIELLLYDQATEDEKVITDELQTLFSKSSFYLGEENISDHFLKQSLTFEFINNLLGPTFPATIKDDCAILKYKGIHFVFKLFQEEEEGKLSQAILIKICIYKPS
jgi:hypothetical protein